MSASLRNVSPIDGRYKKATAPLEEYFSEFALIKYRIRVEIDYFIALSKQIPQIGELTAQQLSALKNIVSSFSLEDAESVKDIEKTTNHDVKAVEYFIKKQLKNTGLEQQLEFVHFGLTSQDINNTAVPLLIKEAQQEVLLPAFQRLLTAIAELATQTKDISLLARTHGQPASPTRLGKEIYVFAERLEWQLKSLQEIPFSAKFGGATGNMNAHKVAYPDIQWIDFANNFVENILGLHRSKTTTQIEHYDHLAALFQNYVRINTILIDFCRDIWTYISMDYFKQKLKEGEIGSSAMPHKVNPIDFENAEGNLGIANALFSHLAEKLPISRLQRDLTDSTVLRNIGVPFGHSLIAWESILRGLNKLIVHEAKIAADLEDNWMVVAEGIQTVLRREGYPQPYEALKNLTRVNSRIGKAAIHQFIDTLPIHADLKTELKAITPQNYVGYA